MPALKIGIQLSSLRMPVKKALPLAARLGASGVEIDARGELNPRDISQSALRQLRKWFDDLNLKVCAVSFRTRRGYDVADDLDRRIAATKNAMTFAHAMGANVVVNQVGQVPAKAEGDAWNLLVEALTDLGRHGQYCGAFLALRTGTESGPQLASLLNAVPEGSLVVDFDPGNLIVNGFSATEAIETLGAHVLHVHAKDAVRDLAQGRGIEVPLGRGTVDFPALIGALEEHRYDGYFTIERENSRDPVHEIGMAVQYLQNM